MYFKVSKLKFIINELFTSLIIPLLFTLILIILNYNIAITSIFWLCSFLYFCLKIDWFYRDELYINDNYIKLNRIKISGKHEILDESHIKETEYVIENLNSFTETPSKFILFGDTYINDKDSIGSLKEKSLYNQTNIKTKKIVIRKNFKDIKKIRKLLDSAINKI